MGVVELGAGNSKTTSNYHNVKKNEDWMMLMIAFLVLLFSIPSFQVVLFYSFLMLVFCAFLLLQVLLHHSLDAFVFLHIKLINQNWTWWWRCIIFILFTLLIKYFCNITHFFIIGLITIFNESHTSFDSLVWSHPILSKIDA